MREELALEPVSPERFITLRVEWPMGIRRYIEEISSCSELCLRFEPGRSFYQFTKPELIREKTQVILRHKETGNLFSGPTAREMIGLPLGERARLKPIQLPDYDIFIQSCSLNRKLVEDTQLLYEK